MKRNDKKMLRKYLLYRLLMTQDKLNRLIDSAEVALTPDEIGMYDSINCDIEYCIYLLKNYDKSFKKNKNRKEKEND